MTAQLIKQAHELRAQAAQLLERAERLLQELRQMPDIITPPQMEEPTTKKNGRIVLNIR